MKHSFLLVLSILFAIGSLSAQEEQTQWSRHQVGGSIGPVHLGVTWKARPTRTFAVETDLVIAGGYNIFLTTPHTEHYCPPRMDGDNSYTATWGLALYSPYINVLFLYNSCRIGKHFDWYIGGGPRIGFIGLYEFSAGYYCGASLAAGFEWHSLKKPLDISFDIRPFFGVHTHFPDYPADKTVTIGVFDCPLTVSFRRRF